MSRARHVFIAAFGRLSLVVRVLPTTLDVDAAYREGKRRQKGRWIHAYFQAGPEGGAHTGTIVLAADGNLLDNVPHEVAHASQHALGGQIDATNEERHALNVGRLSARIFTRLRDLGVEV